MEIPSHYLPIMPYLIVEKASDFIGFLEKVFNAEVKFTTPRSEGIIMHAEIGIGKATVMCCDATETYKPFPASMFLLVGDVETVYRLALENGAVSVQDVAEREYGKSGGFLDPFGNQWWVTEPSEKLFG